MVTIIKRDGREQEFNLEKIKKSITKAAVQVNTELTDKEYSNIFKKCQGYIANEEKITVEKLQDAIEKSLYVCGHRKIRESYRDFRAERTAIREKKTDIMRTIKSIGVHTDNDNGATSCC